MDQEEAQVAGPEGSQGDTEAVEHPGGLYVGR